VGEGAAPKSADGARPVSVQVQRRDEAGNPITEKVAIDPRRTAVVVVDMWDRRWCKTYTARVGNLVPRMNRTLEAARKLGIVVVHEPSDVAAFYRDFPQRRAMQAVPPQPPPRRAGFNPPGPPGGAPSRRVSLRRQKRSRRTSRPAARKNADRAAPHAPRRRLRMQGSRPRQPAPSSSIVAGSGMIVSCMFVSVSATSLPA